MKSLTTKNGIRYRAPVDQMRKQERQKELRRNKKERKEIRKVLARHNDDSDCFAKLILIERQLVGLDKKLFHTEVLKKKQKALMAQIEKRRNAHDKGTSKQDKNEVERINKEMKAYHAECGRLAREAEMNRLASMTDVTTIPLPIGPVPIVRPPMRKRFKDGKAIPPGCPTGIPPEFSDSEDDADEGLCPDNLDPVVMPVQLVHPLLLPIRAPPLPPSLPLLNAVISAEPAVVIAARPQLRDLTAEAVRFVPTQVLHPRQTRRPLYPAKTVAAQQAKSTDKAYEEFMKEISMI